MSANYSSLGRQLLSASVLRGCNLVGAALASFFMMPLVVHHFGDRAYGFWSLATAFIGYYSLLDAGLSCSISQHMSVAIGKNDPGECRSVFNMALRIQSALGAVALLVTVVIAVAAPWICRDPEDARLLWKLIAVLGASVALSFPTRVYGGVLEAELRFDVRAALGLVSLALRTGFFLWVVFADKGLLALAWAAALANVPELILQVVFARREAAWARIEWGAANHGETKSLVSYSVYTTISYIADIVRFQIDPFVITAFIGLAAVTHYRIASVFAQYYLQLIFISVGMLWPVLSRLHGRGDQDRLEEVFFSGTKLACVISVLVALGLIGWGQPLIARWMGPTYEDGYLPLVALSLAILFDVSQKPSIDLLYATFKNRVYVWINWIEGLLNLAFSCLLAGPYGIVGVALGTLIAAFLVRILLQPWWVCKVMGLNYPGYMKYFGKNLLVSTSLAAGAIAASSWGLKPNYLWLISSAIVASGLYAAAVWWFIFDRREQSLIFRALKRDRAAPGEEMLSITGAVL